MFKLKGIKAVTANMNKEIIKIEGKTLQGLIIASIIVRRSMEGSPPRTPVDTGNLRASWFVTTAKGTSAGSKANFKGKDAGGLAAEHSAAIAKGKGLAVTEKKPFLVMGFSAYYAPYTHEMMDASFQRPGAGPKFLETALKTNTAAILKVIKETAKIRT